MASGGVGYWGISKNDTGLESEGRDNCDFLVRDKLGEWIFGLGVDNLYGI